MDAELRKILNEAMAKGSVIDIIIRRIMQQRNLSQSEVSQAIELPPSTFHDWTYGRMPRAPGKLLALSKFFNISFEYLVFGEDDDQAEIKDRIAKLEMENAMFKLEGVSQMNMFDTPEDGLKRIQEMKDTYFNKFGIHID